MRKVIALALVLISLFSLAVPVCASAEGIGDNMAKLGLASLYGEGVERDYEKAFDYFVEADKFGSTKVQFYLGEMCEYGMGVETNLVEAVKWYQKAAEAGVSEAQDKLDTEPMKSIFEAMAVQGQASHTNSSADGSGNDQIPTASLPSEEAAEAGNRAAETGAVSPGGDTAEKSLAYYLEADQRGDTSVLFPLGEIYEYGKGVDMDIVEAVKWYLKASEAGSAEAKKKLEDEPMRSIAEALSVQEQATHVPAATGEMAYIPRRGPVYPQVLINNPVVGATTITIVIIIHVTRGLFPDDWYFYVNGPDNQWRHVGALEITDAQREGQPVVCQLELDGSQTFTSFVLCPVYSGMEFTASFETYLFASADNVGEYGRDVPKPDFKLASDKTDMSVSMHSNSSSPTNLLGYGGGDGGGKELG